MAELKLERSSTDDDIKNAYDKGLSIASISEKTERSIEYIQALVYVEGDNVDGTSVEDDILASGTNTALASPKK